MKRQDIQPRTEHATAVVESLQRMKAADGEYRTKRAIMEIHDQMAEAAQTGIPYWTRSGPPADAEGNFLPLPQWLPGQPRPANWPPHIHAPREVYDWAKANNIDWRTLLDWEGDVPGPKGDADRVEGAKS